MKRFNYAFGMSLFAGFVIGLSLVSVAAPNLLQGKPAQVILIRHAEKPDEGNDLSGKGKERAAALAPMFLNREVLLRFGKPVAIYAERPKKETSSVRLVETVRPLADALDLKVNVTYLRDDYAPMAQEILTTPAYFGKLVVVCWEHGMIPDMAKALGATDAPAKWHGGDFDRLWVITYEPDGKVTFQDLPQKLLFGDKDK